MLTFHREERRNCLPDRAARLAGARLAFPLGFQIGVSVFRQLESFVFPFDYAAFAEPAIL